jgi:uracil-DNA glycosylase family 4
MEEIDDRARRYVPPIEPRRDSEIEPLTKAAYKLWIDHRNANCHLCPLAEGARTVCMFGNGAVPCAGMVVGDAPSDLDDATKRPFQGRPGQYLESVLRDVDLHRSQLYITNAVKCRMSRENTEATLNNAKMACALYLERELYAVKPKAVLALGATAYYFFSHKTAILNARGVPLYSERWGCWVIPTVHPMYVLNNPAYHEMFVADVAKFKRFMLGQVNEQPVIDIFEIHTADDWRQAVSELNASTKLLTFDFETRGFMDYDPEKFQAWCVALTRGEERVPGAGPRVYILPLEHPDSPFIGPHGPLDPWPTPEEWPPDPPLRIAPENRWIIEDLVKLLSAPNRISGHNVKYDARQLIRLAERYNIPI